MMLIEIERCNVGNNCHIHEPNQLLGGNTLILDRKCKWKESPFEIYMIYVVVCQVEEILNKYHLTCKYITQIK